MKRNRCRVGDCRKWEFYRQKCLFHIKKELVSGPQDFQREKYGDTHLSIEELTAIAGGQGTVIFNGDKQTPFLKRFQILPGETIVPGEIVYHKYIHWCIVNGREPQHKHIFFKHMNVKYRNEVYLKQRIYYLKDGTLGVATGQYTKESLLEKYNEERRKKDAKRRDISRKRREAQRASELAKKSKKEKGIY